MSGDAAAAPSPALSRPRRRWLRALGVAVGALIVARLGLHGAASCAANMTPPDVAAAVGEPEQRGDVARLDFAYALKRGGIHEVRLGGTPEAIGHQHGKLLYQEMVQSEQQLYDTFEALVPFSPARSLIVDLGKLSSGGLDRSMAPARLREIAAQARAFSPDPFDAVMPTYTRLVVLNGLYDVALGFEHSPLLGCSTFVSRGPQSKEGHVILARNFDFEAGRAFDEDKVVFLVFEEGKIPFASVAWPGLVGVVSGVNQAGLAVVVHGGRAREPADVGEPVVHTARALLAEARDVNEAVAILARTEARVSHLLVLADTAGNAVTVERAPGVPAEVRREEGPVLRATNHFEGALASDPRNQAVRTNTSTLPRRARLDELVAAGSAPIDAARAVEILRDRRAAGGGELALGDRSALDALIATHGVVIDLTAKTLYVSQGPHLLGGFAAFDLAKLLDPAYVPAVDAPPTIAADPALGDGRYDAWRAAGSPHPGAP